MLRASTSVSLTYVFEKGIMGVFPQAPAPHPREEDKAGERKADAAGPAPEVHQRVDEDRDGSGKRSPCPASKVPSLNQLKRLLI